MHSLLDDEFFESNGLAALTPAQRDQVRTMHIKIAFDAIEEMIAASLNADELQELHAIQHTYGDTAAFDHLSTKLPGVGETIHAELNAVAAGIAESGDTLLPLFGHTMPADDTPADEADDMTALDAESVPDDAAELLPETSTDDNDPDVK